jgi:hypothetical protein
MKVSGKTEIDFAEETRQFFSIQLARYLGSRPSQRFSGLPEHDAVLAMIQDAWVELRASGILENLSREGREAVYVTTIICFPTFVADAGLKCIPVDFITGRRLGEQIIAVASRPTLDG